MALVRVKRRAQDDPVDLLLVACKKSKSSDNIEDKNAEIVEKSAVFKFTATVSSETMAPPNNFQGRDAFHRMNFLYQAAQLARRDFPSSPGVNEGGASLGQRLMLAYSGQMSAVGKKSVSRCMPELKRTVCKGCGAVLTPGDTAVVRTLKKPQQRVLWICALCGRCKLFNTRPGYQTWHEKKEAIVRAFVYELGRGEPSGRQQQPGGGDNGAIDLNSKSIAK